jgi:hypothetical protein
MAPAWQEITSRAAQKSLAVMCFQVSRILISVLLGVWHGKTLANSMPAVGGGRLVGILLVGFTMFVVLMPFFALRELGRDIGDDKLYELFFVRRTKYTPLQS